MMLTLLSPQELAVQPIKRAQERYKKVYDCKSASSLLKVGDWMLVKFPQEEVDKIRKLSRSWYGPHRILTHEEPDVTAAKVYFPKEMTIHVHLSRVMHCPTELSPGFYWYSTKCHSPGHPPRWLQWLLNQGSDTQEVPQDEEGELNPTVRVDSTPTENFSVIDEACSMFDKEDEAKSKQAVVTTPSNRTQKHNHLRKRTAAPQ